jgi:hypothetical protein
LQGSRPLGLVENAVAGMSEAMHHAAAPASIDRPNSLAIVRLMAHHLFIVAARAATYTGLLWSLATAVMRTRGDR